MPASCPVLSFMEHPGFRFKISITTSLSILVCFLILLSVLLSVYFYNLRIEYFYKSEIKNEIEILTDTVASQLSIALYSDCFECVDKIVKANIGRNELVTDALIVLNEGDRVYYDILMTDTGSREGQVFSGNTERGDGTVCLSRPIVYNPGLFNRKAIDNEEVGKLVIWYRETGFLERERLQTMATLAQNINHSLSEAVDAGQFNKMRDVMVNTEISNPNLEYSYLLNNEGVFLHFYMKGQSPKVMHAREGRKVTGAAGKRSLLVSDRKPLLVQDIKMPDGKEVIDISVPIMRKGKRIGVARIGYSMEDFHQSQNKTRRNLLVITVMMVIVGLVSVVLISFSISNPIRKLADTVNVVGDSGFPDEQINMSSRLREVGKLESSFNQMIEKRKFAEHELKHGREQLQNLARRVISTQEEERSRISQELHDELGHRLISLSLHLSAIRKKNLLPEDQITAITDLLEETSREVMRIFRGLSPSFLEKLGLSEALDNFTGLMESQNTFTVTKYIEPFGRGDIPGETAINLFRIAQEAFTNINKYAGASNVEISLREVSGELEMVISDDGKGMHFDWTQLSGGLGLIGMRERVMVLGGRIDIDSSPGNGTSINVSVPLKPISKEDVS